MYCSACGAAIPEGQPACPQCGRPVAPFAGVPPVPGFEYELHRYRSNLHGLAICWFVYAGLTVLLSFVGMSVARHFFMQPGFGPWSNGQTPPWWLHMALSVGWVVILIRAGLAIAAGVGLLEHAQWGKIVAIVAAVLNLIHLPFGTALGIWTLIMLLGYRHTLLYERL